MPDNWEDRLIGEIELSYRDTTQTYSVFDNGEDVKVVVHEQERIPNEKSFFNPLSFLKDDYRLEEEVWGYELPPTVREELLMIRDELGDDNCHTNS